MEKEEVLGRIKAQFEAMENRLMQRFDVIDSRLGSADIETPFKRLEDTIQNRTDGICARLDGLIEQLEANNRLLQHVVGRAEAFSERVRQARGEG